MVHRSKLYAETFFRRLRWQKPTLFPVCRVKRHFALAPLVRPAGHECYLPHAGRWNSSSHFGYHLYRMPADGGAEPNDHAAQVNFRGGILPDSKSVVLLVRRPKDELKSITWNQLKRVACPPAVPAVPSLATSISWLVGLCAHVEVPRSTCAPRKAGKEICTRVPARRSADPFISLRPAGIPTWSALGSPPQPCSLRLTAAPSTPPESREDRPRARQPCH